MSVSGELLCSFELLKPLDSAALKSHIKKGRNKRNSILSSPVGPDPLHMFLPVPRCRDPSGRACAFPASISNANKYFPYSLQLPLPKVTKLGIHCIAGSAIGVPASLAQTPLESSAQIFQHLYVTSRWKPIHCWRMARG